MPKKFLAIICDLNSHLTNSNSHITRSEATVLNLVHFKSKQILGLSPSPNPNPYFSFPCRMSNPIKT
uniref:Uncharacterized protein n=1 Tax=Populus trichocarpa TaxID=3694 RepID=A0A2K2AVH4_POPTR